MTQHKDLATLIDYINKNVKYTHMLNNWPIKTFFSIKNWPSLDNMSSHMIFWLHRKLLIHSPISVNLEKSFTLPFGTLHYLLNSTLSVGYVLELPKNLKMEVTPTFIAVTRGKVGAIVTEVSDVPVVNYFLRDKYLCGYEQNSTMLIACETNAVDFLI